MTAKNRVRTKLPLPGALVLGALMVLVGAFTLRAQAPGAASAKEQPYVVEYYYKLQWGHADEWLALFKKNHLPLLKALKEQGRITGLEMEKPRYHTTEDSRWDFRVTIEWKSYAASNDPGMEEALRRKLFPDQDTFKREEQKRFEILIAHWDLPVTDVSIEP